MWNSIKMPYLRLQSLLKWNRCRQTTDWQCHWTVLEQMSLYLCCKLQLIFTQGTKPKTRHDIKIFTFSFSTIYLRVKRKTNSKARNVLLCFQCIGFKITPHFNIDLKVEEICSPSFLLQDMYIPVNLTAPWTWDFHKCKFWKIVNKEGSDKL